MLLVVYIGQCAIVVITQGLQLLLLSKTFGCLQLFLSDGEEERKEFAGGGNWRLI